MSKLTKFGAIQWLLGHLNSKKMFDRYVSLETPTQADFNAHTSNLVAYHSFPNSFQSVYFVESTAIFKVVGCMSTPILNPFKTWFVLEKIMV